MNKLADKIKNKKKKAELQKVFWVQPFSIYLSLDCLLLLKHPFITSLLPVPIP